MLDIEKLLEEISPDTPSGEDLEYDPDFSELDRIAEAKPEQVMGDSVIPAEEPDWKEVQKKSLELLSRTKDLRVLVHLIRALTRTSGIVGLADGLLFLQRLIEKHWETIHPQLDPDDDNDPILRINTLMSLCDKPTMLRYIREVPLVKSKVMGTFSLHDIAIASGDIKPPASSETAPPEKATINAAFLDSEVEELQKTAEAVHNGIESIRTTESFVTDKVGVGSAPNFSDLSIELKNIEKILSEQLDIRGVAGPEAIPGEENGEGGSTTASPQQKSAPIKGEISSREDVVRMLNKICDYYSKQEPTSPIPYLLNRAKILVPKNFMEILNNLVPNSVDQAEKIFGPKEEEEGG